MTLHALTFSRSIRKEIMGTDDSKQATQNCYHMDWPASRWALHRSCTWRSNVGEPGASVSLCNGTEKYPSYAETMIDRCWYTKRIPARGRTRNKNKTVVPDLLEHFFRPIKYETQDCIISHLPLLGVDCGKEPTHTNTKSDNVHGNHLRHEGCK